MLNAARCCPFPPPPRAPANSALLFVAAELRETRDRSLSVDPL